MVREIIVHISNDKGESAVNRKIEKVNIHSARKEERPPQQPPAQPLRPQQPTQQKSPPTTSIHLIDPPETTIPITTSSNRSNGRRSNLDKLLSSVSPPFPSPPNTLVINKEEMTNGDGRHESITNKRTIDNDKKKQNDNKQNRKSQHHSNQGGFYSKNNNNPNNQCYDDHHNDGSHQEHRLPPLLLHDEKKNTASTKTNSILSYTNNSCVGRKRRSLRQQQKAEQIMVSSAPHNKNHDSEKIYTRKRKRNKQTQRYKNHQNGTIWTHLLNAKSSKLNAFKQLSG